MVDMNAALLLMKSRLNRLSTDTSLEDTFVYRLQGAQEELNQMFRADLTDSTADLMLLVDYTVWSYQNRDQSGAMPVWLRVKLRERFLKGGGSA